MPAEPRPLVIGYGNPLRGDDGAGLFAARLLAGECETIACHQLTPELAEAISQASVVVFIDAHADLAPGEVVIRRLEPGAEETALIHRFDAPGLLRLAKQLYAADPQAWMVGIGAESFEFGERLSPSTESGARKAVAEIRRLLG